MATKLDKVLKRELEMDGQSYIVSISPDGIKVTKKDSEKATSCRGDP